MVIIQGKNDAFTQTNVDNHDQPNDQIRILHSKNNELQNEIQRLFKENSTTSEKL